MTYFGNGAGATPMDQATKTHHLDVTNFMLGVLSTEGKVLVTTPFGSIERSFSALTREQIQSVLSLLGITLTVTPWTTGDATFAGRLVPRTLGTVLGSSGGNTASDSPEAAEPPRPDYGPVIGRWSSSKSDAEMRGEAPDLAALRDKAERSMGDIRKEWVSPEAFEIRNCMAVTPISSIRALGKGDMIAVRGLMEWCNVKEIDRDADTLIVVTASDKRLEISFSEVVGVK